MRTTLDISDDAYQIAKTVAREQNRSLGSVVSDFIKGHLGREGTASPLIPPHGKKFYTTFRSNRTTTSEDARIAVDDEE